jgi:hypothetical protein
LLSPPPSPTFLTEIFIDLCRQVVKHHISTGCKYPHLSIILFHPSLLFLKSTWYYRTSATETLSNSLVLSYLPIQKIKIFSVTLK